MEEKGYSPEAVIDMLGLSRSCIYAWLRRYRGDGLEGLETRAAPGAAPLITAEMDQWLREMVLQSTPEDHGYDTVLWTREILADQGIIPNAQHRTVSKLARRTNHIERLNCTLRQRISRLVRATLSFSKNLANHIGAIQYFLCHYNLAPAAAEFEG